MSDAAALAARRARLDAAHLTELRLLARRIADEQGADVPDPDPLDGGTRARLLLLLETPGPSTGRTGFVSRDNPTGTAANLFRFLTAAGIPRRETLIWNAVPWVIHAPGALNRAPRCSEVATAATYLAPLLNILPFVEVVVLAGRVARLSREPLRLSRPDLPVIEVLHPSPTYVCTSPAVAERIGAGLRDAAKILVDHGSGPAEGTGRLAFRAQRP